MMMVEDDSLVLEWRKELLEREWKDEGRYYRFYWQKRGKEGKERRKVSELLVAYLWQRIYDILSERITYNGQEKMMKVYFTWKMSQPAKKEGKNEKLKRRRMKNQSGRERHTHSHTSESTDLVIHNYRRDFLPDMSQDSNTGNLFRLLSPSALFSVKHIKRWRTITPIVGEKCER